MICPHRKRILSILDRGTAAGYNEFVYIVTGNPTLSRNGQSASLQADDCFSFAASKEAIEYTITPNDTKAALLIITDKEIFIPQTEDQPPCRYKHESLPYEPAQSRENPSFPTNPEFLVLPTEDGLQENFDFLMGVGVPPLNFN